MIQAASRLLAALIIALPCAAWADSPRFVADPAWPKKLPHGWCLGQVSGVAVDAADHVWIVQRPRTLSRATSARSACVPAPPVIAFDASGAVLRAWGGPGQGFDWPESEHGIAVDADCHLWIGGNGPDDGQVLKFSEDGHLLLQIGHPARGAANADTARLGRPADIAVDTHGHEVFVADGYTNRRVVVFDSVTGAFKRLWGAYGRKPTDRARGRAQFGTPVHCLKLSRDKILYVCDRRNSRIQVFREDGSFVAEWRVPGVASAWDIGLSPDPAQNLIYVADGAAETVHLLLRQGGAVASAFGASQRFSALHSLAVDSRGDVFAGEVGEAGRVRRFVPYP
jgi:DNA-binding beta-propeller fold protein YncE